MGADYMREYEKWLNFAGLDAGSRARLEAIRGDDGEIKEWFHAPLEFGTAGLRGIM